MGVKPNRQGQIKSESLAPPAQGVASSTPSTTLSTHGVHPLIGPQQHELPLCKIIIGVCAGRPELMGDVQYYTPNGLRKHSYTGSDGDIAISDISFDLLRQHIVEDQLTSTNDKVLHYHNGASGRDVTVRVERHFFEAVRVMLSNNQHHSMEIVLTDNDVATAPKKKK